MSNLFIAEFDELVITDNGIPPFGKFDAATKLQTVTIGGSASSPFQATTKLVRVVVDATCIISYTLPGAESTQVPFLRSHTSGRVFRRRCRRRDRGRGGVVTFSIRARSTLRARTGKRGLLSVPGQPAVNTRLTQRATFRRRPSGSSASARPFGFLSSARPRPGHPVTYRIPGAKPRRCKVCIIL